MRKNFYKRIEKLEQHYTAVQSQKESCAEPADHSGTEIIREFLRANNVEQPPEESLTTAFARALGLSNRELRRILLARAYGDRYVLSPAHGLRLEPPGSRWRD
jgi:hypothetical protein